MITFINQTEQTNWNEYESRFQEIFNKTRNVLKIDKDYEISIILVDAEEIHQINRDYRNIDRPTDVISFALKDSDDEFFIDEVDLELGDIFINIEAVVNQAKEYGHSECREISFLCTHGILHLLGYDHMNEEDEKEMFGLQEELLNEYKITR